MKTINKTNEFNMEDWLQFCRTVTGGEYETIEALESNTAEYTALQWQIDTANQGVKDGK